MSGNEIYCLGLKGLLPGELALGNSVQSLGILGAVGSWGSSLAGGEIAPITELISNGRHAAIARMEDEAKRAGAIGVTGVTSRLTTLASYTEFLAQGTGVHATHAGAPFFSTAASGIDLYCHLDAGYQPVKFVMGNVAYALGIGRGITGSLRTLARGEVREYSEMYNGIRHLALERLRMEAAALGANAVVDIATTILPCGPGAIELLMTGTASHHPHMAHAPLHSSQVVTSELSGEELWNLAAMGLIPVRLVMATSVYSLGVVSNIGAMFRSMSKGEIPEVTKLVYEARENCLELLRQEAIQCGAERVIGNRLMIRELAAGMIEVVAIGTAVRRAQGFTPQTPQLIPQAVISERQSLSFDQALPGMPNLSPVQGSVGIQGRRAQGCVPIAFFLIWIVITLVSVIIGIVSKK